jgi:hypothetical protein
VKWLIILKCAINIGVAVAKVRGNPPLGLMFFGFAFVDLTTFFLYARG